MRLFHYLIVSLLIMLITALAKPAMAVYDPQSVDNNRFGIHILFPEELGNAAKLVNSGGGEWGYVTIPIQSTDRNIDKWQKFLDDCKKLKIIPIIRLATYPKDSYWTKPTVFDPLDWTNFLNSLSWPIKNRYIIVYNEPNHAEEWGNELNPADYANQLSDTSDALKRANEDFFILNAGFDSAAPNSNNLMDEYDYLWVMYQTNPDIFKKIDGWSSHSYPNPGFSGNPYSYTSTGIRGYQFELSFLQNDIGVYGLPVFITETGWKLNPLSEEQINNYYSIAFNEIWIDPYLIAVTPFLLTASGQFEQFCWILPNNEETMYYKNVCSMKKISGQPKLSEIKNINNAVLKKDKLPESNNSTNWPMSKSENWNKFIKWLFNY